MINHFRLVWLWILMSNICKHSLSHSRRLLVFWHRFQRYRSSSRFLFHLGDASHRYPCLFFFQRGGTSYRGHGSTSTWEHSSLIDILLLGGGTISSPSSPFWGGIFPHRRFCPSPFSYVYTWMYVIMGRSWLLHPSMHPFSSLFLGEVFSHVVFPSFPTLWEMCICIIYMGT